MANQFTNKWTEKLNKQLKELVMEGKNPKEISLIIGRSESSISTQKTRIGVKSRRLNYSKKINENKAYLLGMIVGDGYITSKVVGMSAVDKEFTQKVCDVLNEEYYTRFKPIRNSYCNQWQIETKRKDIKENLMHFLKGHKTFDWNVPKIIKKSSKKIIISYLRGLTDSEGSVSKDMIRLAIAKEDSIKEIQELLLKLDIQSKIYKGAGCYDIAITNYESKKNFMDKIGFTITRKKTKLIETLTNQKNKHTRKDYEKVLELRKQGLGYDRISHVTNIHRSTIQGWTTLNKVPSAINR